jgi:hypothetical protein
MSRRTRLKGWWANAFALDSGPLEPTPEERELVERLAGFVVRRRLAAPALLALESGRPLSFLGSQVLAFLAPFATTVFSPTEYERFAAFLERQQSVDALMEAIVRQEDQHHA